MRLCWRGCGILNRRHNGGAALRMTIVAKDREHADGRDYVADLGGVEAEGNFAWTVVSVTDARNLSTVYERGFAVRRPAATPDPQHHSTQAHPRHCDAQPQNQKPAGATPTSASSAPPAPAPPLFAITARARPTVSFATDRLLLSTSRRETAGLIVTGRAPWTIQVQHTPADAAAVTAATVVNAAAGATIDVAAPGEYRLVNVADAFCTGAVLEPRALRAELAPLPTVVWDTSSAPAAVCLGANLVTIPLTLTGRGPWHLTYKETVCGRWVHTRTNGLCGVVTHRAKNLGACTL